jgi:hypothetical protein
VHGSPGLLAATRATDARGTIRPEAREAFLRVLAHFGQERFHCAHAVFAHLGDAIAVDQELLDCTAAFVGGTLLMGMTCGALVAGIMAVGLSRGEIESSRLRVMRMIALMALGGPAFDDDVNKFNRIMNIGNRIAARFAADFGSTQCRSITACDFSTQEGVRCYMDRALIDKCRRIAEAVAEMTRDIVREGAGV